MNLEHVKQLYVFGEASMAWVVCYCCETTRDYEVLMLVPYNPHDGRGVVWHFTTGRGGDYPQGHFTWRDHHARSGLTEDEARRYVTAEVALLISEGMRFEGIYAKDDHPFHGAVDRNGSATMAAIIAAKNPPKPTTLRRIRLRG